MFIDYPSSFLLCVFTRRQNIFLAKLPISLNLVDLISLGVFLAIVVGKS